MRPESAIQKWMVERARSGSLIELIEFGGTPLDVEIEESVSYRSRLKPSHPRKAHDAVRVLQSLVEPEFLCADENISDLPGVSLKPDLLLRDVIGGAFVVIELKRDRAAAREFATELLAYADCLRRQHPRASVFLVAVSTSWRPLETHATAQLQAGRFPVLPLQFEEGSHGPRLRVRTDLLAHEPYDGRIHSDALLVETKTFLDPGRGRRWNQAAHMLRHISHGAAQGTASGFALAWQVSSDAVLVSIAVHDPSHEPQLPHGPMSSDDAPTEEDLDRAFLNNPWHFGDDTATRLLLEAQLGLGMESYSSESEGTWKQLEARLQREDAQVLGFEAFGDFGDRMRRWLASDRDRFAPMVADLTAFPPWHPLTWLPLLDSLVHAGEAENSAPLIDRATLIGEAIAKFTCQPPNGSISHFGRGAAQARFLAAWEEIKSLTGKAIPPLVHVVNGAEIQFGPRHVRYEAFDLAFCRIRERGEELGAAFVAGAQRAGYPIVNRY
jgi:hypothetical protein